MQNKYEILSVIGEGSYGIVYKCRNKETNEIVAIKKFKDKADISTNKSMLRELKSLKIFNNKNIINFRESFKKKGSYFFVFDYIEKNILQFLTEYPDGIEPNLIKHIIFQICSGIKEIHKYNLVHRDIKPENVLIDRTHKIKICDFGFTRFIEKNSNEYLTEYVATRWYRAPELLIGDKKYGLEIDYWSIGCIMGELIDGNPIFPGEDDMEQIYMIYKICGRESFSYEQIQIIEKKHNITSAKIEKTKYINPLNNSEISIEIGLDKRYSGKVSREALSFLKRLLDPNPLTRMKSDELFDHPYLLNYYQIYDANNELYINNFDYNNKFIKNANTSYRKPYRRGSHININNENNSSTSQSSLSNKFNSHLKTSSTSNNFYSHNNINSNNNDTNAEHYQSSKSKEIGKEKSNEKNSYTKGKMSISTSHQYYSNFMNNSSNIIYTRNNISNNNNNFVPIIENNLENVDSNSYEEVTKNTNEKDLNLVLVPGTKQCQESNNDKNIIKEKNKIGSEISNNKNNSNQDLLGNEKFNSVIFNDYNIEEVKPPNKEERSNFNYYNNIKLYNEDLFEKTGKINNIINPYESIYKIAAKLKKESIKNKKNKKDYDKVSAINNNSSLSYISMKIGKKGQINIHDQLPISDENYNSNLKNYNSNTIININNNYQYNINFDDKIKFNKIFLSPQKSLGPSEIFSNNDPYKTGIGTNNITYINEFSNDKTYKSTTNMKDQSFFNNLKQIRLANKVNNDYNNLNKPQPSLDKSYYSNNIQNPSLSPDIANENKNISSNKKYSVNINSNNFSNNNNIISSINNNLTKSNKFNNSDFSIGKSIVTKPINNLFSNKNFENTINNNSSLYSHINSNLNINNNNNNNNHINDFLQNIIYQNNMNYGLTSVNNTNIDHKRFNSLNAQNSLFVNGEEYKKVNNLKKLQLPIIPKKEIGNKV